MRICLLRIFVLLRFFRHYTSTNQSQQKRHYVFEKANQTNKQTQINLGAPIKTMDICPIKSIHKTTKNQYFNQSMVKSNEERERDFALKLTNFE